MRKALSATALAIGALLWAGIATGTGLDGEVRSGNTELIFGATFAPKALSRTAPTPIAVRLWARVKSLDGATPTVVSELAFDADENTAVDLSGFPTCSGGRRETRTANPLKGCTDAIVGAGTAVLDFHFPETSPMPVKAQLTIYNGGGKAGVTTLFARAYTTAPITTAVVIPIRLGKIKEARFGGGAVVVGPKTAGENISLTSFTARIGRSFLRNGKRVSILTAKCPNEEAFSRMEARLADGDRIQSPPLRTCVPSS
jgi:hypothetical protein